MRVGGQRAEQPLELADPVAHRVVVEELQPRRLGHVEVRVEQHLQRLAQVGRLGGGLGQRAEHVAGERAQLGGVGDQRDQPVQAELVEERRRAAAVHPAADLDRPPGLGVGLGQLVDRVAPTRLTPTENGRRPPPLSPATAVTARRTTSWPATGSGVRRRRRPAAG